MQIIPFIQNFKTVIVADGSFPKHEIPLSMLQKASTIISCDGATFSLLDKNIEPSFIIGDLDSLNNSLKEKYSSILYRNPDQETNDLTKAVNFCIEKGLNEITIIGATGKREDHTIGNIALLADYAANDIKIQMVTNYGIFYPIITNSIFESFCKQQVSIFSFYPSTELNSEGLAYKLENRKFKSWWEGTLNESLSSSFTITSKQEIKVLVYRTFNGKS